MDNKHLGITYDKTNVVEISEQQFSTYQRLTDNFAA